jgi:hypothetical protein
MRSYRPLRNNNDLLTSLAVPLVVLGLITGCGPIDGNDDGVQQERESMGEQVESDNHSGTALDIPTASQGQVLNQAEFCHLCIVDSCGSGEDIVNAGSERAYLARENCVAASLDGSCQEQCGDPCDQCVTQACPAPTNLGHEGGERAYLAWDNCGVAARLETCAAECSE